MRKLAILLILSAFSALGGCGSAKTETGYAPHTLSMTDAQRRSLYASPFSPEAQGIIVQEGLSILEELAQPV